MKSYSEALKYLNSFTDYEKIGFKAGTKDFDLDKLRKVLKKAGDPHRNYRSIHVAGTKGKGSICAFTSSILTEAGYRVGLFTSPHLDIARERIQINGELIKESDLVHVLSCLQEHLGPGAEEKFTFFEVYTLASMMYFSMQKVDFAVFEVGMGGRLDATNVIDAEVCGISPVSYDHMQVLGKRLDEITREKTAIVKNGSVCISSPQRAAARSVIANRCAKEEVPLSFVGEDIVCGSISSSEEGSYFDIRSCQGYYKKCRTNMLGTFQTDNCATAVGICEQVLTEKEIDKETIKKGIARAYIPGRLEILCRKPLIVIDGAQNADSALQLKHSVEQIFKYDKLILLLGLSKDKDISGVCRQLAPAADEIILTRASSDRAEDPHLIRGYVKGRQVKVTQDTTEALGMAFHMAGENDMILATGSFFLISEVRRILGVRG